MITYLTEVSFNYLIFYDVDQYLTRHIKNIKNIRCMKTKDLNFIISFNKINKFINDYSNITPNALNNNLL